MFSLLWKEKQNKPLTDSPHGQVCSCYMCRLDRALDEVQLAAGVSIPVIPVSVSLLIEEVKAGRDPLAFAQMLVEQSRRY